MMIKFDKKDSHLKAFSLIEISVVILVVGILIAGISKGIDLYQDFKLATARNLTNNSIVGRIEGLTLWLEPTLTKSFTKEQPNDNELIAQWNDINPQRTFKINVTQSNSSKRPTYVRNAINNLPALKFAGNILLNSANITTNDIMSYDQVTAFFVQNNFSDSEPLITISFDNNLGGGAYRFLVQARGLSGSGANQFWWGICCPTQSRLYLNASAQTFYKNQIYSVLKNGSYSSMRVNFNQMSSSSNSTTSNLLPSLAAPFFVGTNFVGHIAEVIIFNRALSEKERYEIEKYLSQKWGIKLG